MNQELTFGERLCGIDFNPSKDPRIDQAKRLCADLADLLNNANEVKENKSYLSNSIFGQAVRDILAAQMMVVKSLTFKY